MGQKAGTQMDDWPRLMRIALFAMIFITIWILVSMWSRDAMPREQKIGGAAVGVSPWLQEPKEEEEESEPICEELAWDATVYYASNEPRDFGATPDPADRAEYERSYDLMVDEVVMLWTMFFDDDGAKATDPRRDRFFEFAEHLVDAVIMYQDRPTDLGGQLPKHENVHLLAAHLVTRESSVTPGAVGHLGEVGLMQIMPNNRAALAGYSAKKVSQNPKLSLLLGVRWLAYSTTECPGVDVFDPGWDDYDWVKPLSVYAGGPNAKRSDGTCRSFGLAKRRVKKTIMYRTRINHAMEHGID